MSPPEDRPPVNTWEQLTRAHAAGWPKGHCLGITRYNIAGRGVRNVIGIFSPFFQTDPDAHWIHKGSRVFTPTSGALKGHAAVAAAQELAKAWARETLGYTGEWARNWMGDLLPAQVNRDFPLRPRAARGKEPTTDRRRAR